MPWETLVDASKLDASVRDSCFFRSDEPLEEEDEEWQIEYDPDNGVVVLITEKWVVEHDNDQIEHFMRLWKDEKQADAVCVVGLGNHRKWFLFDGPFQAARQRRFAAGADDPETRWLNDHVTRS